MIFSKRSWTLKVHTVCFHFCEVLNFKSFFLKSQVVNCLTFVCNTVSVTITDGPQLTVIQLMMVQKWYTFSRNCNSNFEFLSFPQLAICSTYSLMTLGSSSEPQLPVSHWVNNWHPYSHSVPMQPFCFSLSVHYSINYMKYSMDTLIAILCPYNHSFFIFSTVFNK